MDIVNEFSLKKNNAGDSAFNLTVGMDNALAEKSTNVMSNLKSIKDFKNLKGLVRPSENNENCNKKIENLSVSLGKSKEEDSRNSSQYQQSKHSIIDQISSPKRKMTHF